MTTVHETVASYTVERVREDRYPVVVVHYVGTRGTRRTSEVKWNTIEEARRHGQRLVGKPMR